MKKQQVDHVLRAAGRITGEKQFVIIGSQSLHGKYPDVADEIVMSAEVDLIAAKNPQLTELLNEIGAEFAVSSKSRLLRRPGRCDDCDIAQGMEGPAGELASRRYLRRKGAVPGSARSCDRQVCRPPREGHGLHPQLARRGLVSRDRLLAFLDQTPVAAEVRQRIRADIASDFGSPANTRR